MKKSELRRLIREEIQRLNESELPFKKVKPGMTAYDYSGNEYKVIAIGYGKDWNKLKKYDSSGAMEEMMANPEDYDYTKDDLKSLELIVAEDEDDTYVWTYGEDGAYVKK